MNKKDIEIIKQAFWKTFNASGEQWFPYILTPEGNSEATNFIWEEFLENIKKASPDGG